MSVKRSLPPVNTWGLISDGIESPLRGGFYRGIKYMDISITDDQIETIISAQQDYLMNWFAETFRFDDGYDDE